MPRASHLAILFLFAGLIVTGWGLKGIGLPAQGFALSNGLMWLVLFALVAFTALAGRWHAVGVAAGLGVGFALISGQLWPFLVALWFVAAAMVVGCWILRVLGMREPQTQPVICFLCGAGVLGTSAGLLAHLPVNHPGTYAFALALPLVLGWGPLAHWVSALRKSIAASAAQPRAWQKSWVSAAAAAAALVHFMVAFLPDLGPDALAVHLFLAADLRANHRWGFDAGTYVWAVMPLLVDWTYAITYMLGGETAARLVNVAYLFSLAWLLRELVLWAGGSALGASWALLLFFTTPLTFTESSTLFIEAGWSAWLVAGILYLLRALESPAEDRSALPLTGLLFGFALAAKAVTLSILPVLLLVLLARPSAWTKAEQRLLAFKAVLLGVAAGSVPYLTALLITGNPVFPFFNALFKSPFYPSENFEAPPFERYLSWDTVYRVTFESVRYLESYAGVAGFQWLLLLVPCVVALVALPQRRNAAAVLVVIAVLAVASVFQQTAYLRYVFPALVILLAAMGVGLGVLLQAPGSLVWPFAGGAAVLLNIAYFHVGSKYADFPFPAAFSVTARIELLAERQPFRSIVPVLNELNVDRTPVFWIAKPLGAGVTADQLYREWYNHRFFYEFMAVRSEQAMVSLMTGRGSEYAVVDMRSSDLPSTLLLNVTDEVARRAHVSLRRLKPSLHFTRELLASPDFSDPSAWTLVPGAQYDPAARSFLVSPQASAYQVVPVMARRKYLNTISARCAKDEVEGRLQVNWAGADGRFLGVSSLAYRCAPEWTRHSFEVIAPHRAVAATVYTTGHYGGLVSVSFNSFMGSGAPR